MIKKLITIAVLICSCLFYSCNLSQAATTNNSTEIPVSKVKENIVKHSIEMGVDPALALSIAKHESKFQHSSKGSDGTVGVFQIKPSTAKRLGYNPYLLNDNIKCALHYYKMMYKKFGSVELALAAYNAGPGNVAKYKGMPPFKGTKTFVSSIMKEYKNQKTNPDITIVNAKKAIAQARAAEQKKKQVVEQAKPKVETVTETKTETKPETETQTNEEVQNDLVSSSAL